MLTDFFVYLGVSEAVAAADACKVEHDLSAETFAKIKEHVRRTMEADGPEWTKEDSDHPAEMKR